MKLMKKLSCILLCILLAVSFSLSAFAAEGVTSTAPGAELRKAADALDLVWRGACLEQTGGNLVVGGSGLLGLHGHANGLGVRNGLGEGWGHQTGE